MPRNIVGSCPFNGKDQYATESSARKALRSFQARSRTIKAKAPERIYGDCQCGFFHLTSRPTKETLGGHSSEQSHQSHRQRQYGEKVNFKSRGMVSAVGRFTAADHLVFDDGVAA